MLRRRRKPAMKAFCKEWTRTKTHQQAKQTTSGPFSIATDGGEVDARNIHNTITLKLSSFSFAELVGRFGYWYRREAGQVFPPGLPPGGHASVIYPANLGEMVIVGKRKREIARRNCYENLVPESGSVVSFRSCCAFQLWNPLLPPTVPRCGCYLDP